MRVLLAKNDDICLNLVLHEVKKDFVVDLANAYKDVNYCCDVVDYDALIIFGNVTDTTSLEICKIVRLQSESIPILFISDRHCVYHKVKVLESGADAYISRPVDTLEMRACLKALIRRKCLSPSSKEISYNGITLDLKKRKVFLDGCEVYMCRKEFDLVEYLLLNINQVVSVERILEHVWDIGLDVASNTVEVHIRRIREKLGKDVIKTRHGYGYIIES